MEIRGSDGVRGIDNNSKINSLTKKNSATATSADTAEISSEAKQLAEEAKLRGILDRTPDVRQDKIDEVKAKLENGDYNNEEIMNAVAEKLMKVLGL
jgi:negative regulator of flagellin synthesis FlgM